MVGSSDRGDECGCGSLGVEDQSLLLLALVLTSQWSGRIDDHCTGVSSAHTRLQDQWRGSLLVLVRLDEDAVVRFGGSQDDLILVID